MHARGRVLRKGTAIQAQLGSLLEARTAIAIPRPQSGGFRAEAPVEEAGVLEIASV